MLPALSTPYAQASTAIATPPAMPPFMPADIGIGFHRKPGAD